MRILKTIFWLAGATLAGLFTVYFNIIPAILIPLLFGLAVNFSNQEYMKYKLSEWAIPITFIAIFLWGTVPFYILGGLIFENKFGATFFGAVGSFLLASITLKLTIKEIYIGYVQLLVAFLCAFIAVYLHAMFTGQSIKNYEKGITERIDLTVAIFQSLMIVLILTTMIRIPVRSNQKNMKTIETKKAVTTFDELIERRHGKTGTEKRTDFEIKAKSFAAREIIVHSP